MLTAGLQAWNNDYSHMICDSKRLRAGSIDSRVQTKADQLHTQDVWTLYYSSHCKRLKMGKNSKKKRKGTLFHTPNTWEQVWKSLWYRGWGKRMFTVVSTQNTELILVLLLLIIVLFSIWTPVNLLLPLLAFPSTTEVRLHIQTRVLHFCFPREQAVSSFSGSPKLPASILFRDLDALLFTKVSS